MKKVRKARWWLVLGVFVVAGWRFGGVARADECDNPRGLSDVGSIQQCIARVKETYEAIAKANTTNKDTLAAVNKQLEGIKKTITVIEKNVVEKERLIGLAEQSFDERYKKLARSARSYYILSRSELGVGMVLASGDAKRSITVIGILSSVTRRDKEVIVEITKNISGLSEQKKELALQRENLEKVKASVDTKAKFYATEVAKASAYEESLSTKITSLTARQNEILTAKTGVFQTSVGDVPLADDPNARPDYNPGFSPAFAAFSFGAPHYRGMSQYGALGRAKAGQGFEEILRAYYGNVRIETVDTGLSIRTSAGTMGFEDRYVMGIAEMPSRWGGEGGMEALKAQAIAARSYALAYTGWRMGNRNSNGSICVTEACQVWKSSKADNPGEWRTAVEQTRGKILVSSTSGEVVNSWYASTSGGYQESYASLGHSTPGFWDTPRGREGWTGEAYEKTAGSPWFYKGWYRDRGGSSCGKSHPWLNEEEFADILNAWVVRYRGNADEVARVSPVDTGCWGGNPYSREEMKERARAYGGGYSRVTAVNVSYSTNGVTASVNVETDKGAVNIPGGEFKTAFNLRAPGKVSIKSGLFNVEKK